MARCPAAKRAYTVVDAKRFEEFENSIVALDAREKSSMYNRTRDPITFFSGRARPHAMLDALHSHFREPERWRLIAGVARRNWNRDWWRDEINVRGLDTSRTVHWVLVQFNNGRDAVEARLVFDELLEK